MATETAKRKQTMQVLNQLKMPPPGTHRNGWTGEELPAEEAGAQADFEAQQEARMKQEMLNKADLSAPTAAMVGMQSGMAPGPTGMGTPAAPGMVPYSPEELDRRSGFIRTGVEALDQPPAKNKGKKKSKPEDFVEADEPVQTTGSN